MPSEVEEAQIEDAFALLFDLATAQPRIMAQFAALPPRLLIGVDLTAGTLLVLTGRSVNGKTIDDFMATIMEKRRIQRSFALRRIPAIHVEQNIRSAFALSK